MPTQQTFTFEEHDKLNRKPFAEFLFSLIQHRNEYRRPDSNKSYSIAIDAVYGSGSVTGGLVMNDAADPDVAHVDQALVGVHFRLREGVAGPQVAADNGWVVVDRLDGGCHFGHLCYRLTGAHTAMLHASITSMRT